MFDSLNIYFGKNVKQLKATVPMKIKKKKKIVILSWYCRNRTKGYGTRNLCRSIPKMDCFLEKCIKTCHINQQIKIKSEKANFKIENFEAK